MAENFLFPAVVVREVRSGVPQIRGVPTSVGGMLVRAKKGWSQRKVRIGSFAQFSRIFGGYDPNSYSAESVDAFFKNGGSSLWVNRVLGSSGGGAANTKAAIVLDTAGAVDAVGVTSVGEGVQGNNQRVLVTKESVVLGKVLAAAISMGAVSSFRLTASGAARVTVGDTISLSDTVGPITIRGVVQQIKNNTIMLAATVPTAGSGLATATTTVSLETWSLTFFEDQSITQGPLRGLRMSSLSQKNYFMTRINTDNDENQFTVTDSAAPIGATSLDNRPVNTDATNGDLLTGGDEFTTFADADYIGTSNGQTGFYAFDKAKDLRMLAVPGVTGTTAGAISKAGLDYATTRGDCVFFCEPPQGTAVTAANTYKNDNLGGTSYGAMYYPWVQIVDPLSSQPAYSPPSGYIMGMVARTDRLRGIQKAPAGELDGRLVGTIGLERDVTDDEWSVLYPSNINVIRNIPGVGQCCMGSRTLESGQFNQLSVRRTFIYLEQSMKNGTTWVLFEPNDKPTRARVRRSLASFLTAEWRKGTLEGDSLDEAFWVTCDSSNNPQVFINGGIMTADCGVNIPGVTETLVISVQQDQRGAEAAVGV